MIKNKNIRKLTTMAGHSLGILLPKDMLRQLGWHERRRLLVQRKPGGIFIRDAATKHKKKH